MGMFKSINEVKKMGKESQAKYESEGGMAAGLDRMKAMNEMLAQQTQAANIAATGADATAMISGVAQTGGMVNYQPTLKIDLTVMPDGLPPYPATVTQVVEQIYLGKAVAGAAVPIKVDPENPGSIWINWAMA
jgi:hypothetical protein